MVPDRRDRRDPATGNGVGASDGHREQTGVVARQWKASPGLPMITTATAVLIGGRDSHIDRVRLTSTGKGSPIIQNERTN